MKRRKLCGEGEGERVVQGTGFKVQGSGSGFRVQGGSGFTGARVHGCTGAGSGFALRVQSARSRVADLISIIVPVYNEESTIATVIDLLRTVPLPAAREIIVVNDGSRDGTRATLDAIDGRFPEVSIVNVPENRGKGHAIRVGLARTRGSVAAIQDADLELDPSQLGSLVAPILAGDADVVYGSRFLTGAGAASGIALAGNRLLTWLTNVLYGSSLTDIDRKSTRLNSSHRL